MEKFDTNMKSKNIDLKVRFEKAKEDPTFLKMINEIDLPIETLRKYTSSLEDAAKEKALASGIFDKSDRQAQKLVCEFIGLLPNTSGYKVAFK